MDVTQRVHLRTRSHQESRAQSSVSDGLWEEVRAALRDWRSHLSHGCELVEPFDPEHDHVRGDPAAKVVVVEYSELGTPAASDEERAVRQALRDVLDKGGICLAVRHFPMIDAHPGTWLGAQAVEAAHLQGRFWDLHGALTDLETLPWARDLDAGSLLTVARELKLDIARLEADMADPAITARILGDLYSGIRSGVNGAPSFYVQGIRQDIDRPDELLDRIEHALAGDFAALWPPVHERASKRAESVTASARKHGP